MLVGSEIHRRSLDSAGQDRPAIIASVVEGIEDVPAPLGPNYDNIEVSDIIWGYGPGEKNHKISRIPFIIPPIRKFPAVKIWWFISRPITPKRPTADFSHIRLNTRFIAESEETGCRTGG